MLNLILADSHTVHTAVTAAHVPGASDEITVAAPLAVVATWFPSLSETDIAGRKEKLRFLGYWNASSFFWKHFEGFIHLGSQGSGLSSFLQQAGTRLADMLQIHYSRNVSELVQRVKDHNPDSDWVNGEGQPVISSVKEGKSDLHDPISLFWILNTHLPNNNQMTFIPESGFTDQFFVITEAALLTALLREDANTKDLLGFASQREALNYASEHPGDLVYRMFFSSSLHHSRGSYLENPGPNVAASLALLQTDKDDSAQWEELTARMRETDGTAYLAAKKSFSEFEGSTCGPKDP
ncbi:MAG: hypothetical protein J3Q66DRAFT_374980 [Benniella sp.]|nr:MAG: hypothetical protein J3Q66DRAFT_374980 [Benniella sp.]